MNFLKSLLKNWIFWMSLIMVCFILTFVDIRFDLTNFGILSLISVVLSIISIIALLIIRSINDGIRKLLTVVICSGSLGIIALLYDMYYWDIEFILSLIRTLFFISGTILLLKLVWRKK